MCKLIETAAADCITSQRLLPGISEQLGAVASPYRLLVGQTDWQWNPVNFLQTAGKLSLLQADFD